jgi:CRP-like cAMP-binding protein
MSASNPIATIRRPPSRAGRRSVWEELAERVSLSNYRPKLRDDLNWIRLRTRHGAPYAMVHEPGSDYLRLSEEDDFLAQRMDGTRRLGDLVVEYMDKFGSMDFDAVAELVEDLRAHGFLTDPPRDLYEDLETELHPPPPRRFTFAQGSLLDIEFPVRGVDGFVTALYRRLGWIFYTRLALIASVVIAIFGLGLCVAEIFRGHDPLAPLAGSQIAGIVALVAAYFIATFLHESAHAVTCKHFGGHIPEGGFNLYYFLPAFYVDVTEAWLQPWQRRIAISAAGTYSGFVLSGLCCIVVWFLPGGFLATVLFKIAVVSYLDDAFNLMPLLKLDGYYILSDWLEIPRLRERALAFIAGPMWRTVFIDRQRLSRRETLYAVFGALAAVYSFVSIYIAFAWWGRRLKPIIAPLWQTPGLFAKVFAAAVLAVIFVPLSIALGRRLWRYQRKIRQAPKAAAEAVEMIRIRDRLKLLEGVAFLEALPEAVAERLARAAHVRKLSAGTQVVRQGDRGDEFFVISEGRATVMVRSQGDDHVVGNYAAGDFFGERALLGGGVRAATIVADTPLKLLVFDKGVFWRELAGPLQWRARIEQAIEERQRLHAVPLFRGLGERQLDILAVKMSVRPFAVGDVLIRQGDAGDAFYVVREGSVSVLQQEGRVRRKLATLSSGGYFGEIALLRDAPRMASVVGADAGSVWQLGRRDFQDIVARHLDLEGRLSRRASSRVPRGHAVRRYR